MLIQTRDFGEVTISPEDIIEFVQPLYGFENLHRFVFLYEQSISDHFIWMQSVEERNICFILVDPAVVVGDYSPSLPDVVCEKLGDEDYMCWLIVVVAEQFEKSTVNLKSPIVVNPEKRLAIQVILEEDFPIRHPLVQHIEEGGKC